MSNETGFRVVTRLRDQNDVTIASPSNGQVLSYNSATSKWINSGGGAGTSGYSGYSGSGASGYSGYSGTGLSGYSGYSGPAGSVGAAGASGYSGYSGVGTSGYSGYSGRSGYSGFSGYSGAAGATGATGGKPCCGYYEFTFTHGGLVHLDAAGLDDWEGINGFSYEALLLYVNGDWELKLIAQGDGGAEAIFTASYTDFPCPPVEIANWTLQSASPFLSGVQITNITNCYTSVGRSGYSGYSGRSGYSGTSTSGYSGYSGSAGATGASGYSGYSGIGLSGYSGYSGAAGVASLVTGSPSAGTYTPDAGSTLQTIKYQITASSSFTLANPINCTNGQQLLFRIRNTSGGAITVLLGANFRFGSDVTAITDIAAGKTDYVGTIYNTDNSVTKHDLLSYVKGY